MLTRIFKPTEGKIQEFFEYTLKCQREKILIDLKHIRRCLKNKQKDLTSVTDNINIFDRRGIKYINERRKKLAKDWNDAFTKENESNNSKINYDLSTIILKLMDKTKNDSVNQKIFS